MGMKTMASGVMLLLALSCGHGQTPSNLRTVGVGPEFGEPLTIAFEKVNENPGLDIPGRIYWSINSAGECEETVSYLLKKERHRVACSPESLRALRNVLAGEQLGEIKNSYGPQIMHGGWSKFVIVLGGSTSVTCRLNTPCGAEHSWDKKDLISAMPALRIWLKLCDVVDPKSKVFEERSSLAERLLQIGK
jgi:hypothetical protein